MVCDASGSSTSQENGPFHRNVWPGLISPFPSHSEAVSGCESIIVLAPLPDQSSCPDFSVWLLLLPQPFISHRVGLCIEMLRLYSTRTRTHSHCGFLLGKPPTQAICVADTNMYEPDKSCGPNANSYAPNANHREPNASPNVSRCNMVHVEYPIDGARLATKGLNTQHCTPHTIYLR